MSKIKYLLSMCFVAVVICCMSVSVDLSAEETEICIEDFSWEYNDIWGITQDNTICITGYTGTDETVFIPSEIEGKKVKSIGTSAFYQCETLKHLIIQEGITEINSNAFAWCKNLETVMLPEGITNIEMGAFAGCESLINIDIPDTVHTIEVEAFANCFKLMKIKLPNKLRVIKDSTFSNCKFLQTIEIPNSVERIESWAFACCNNLNYIEIPNGVTEICDGAFLGCESLTKIVIPDSVKRIWNSVFEYCIETKEGYIATNKVLDNLVVFANPNSYARTYANKIGIKFSCLNIHDWDNGSVTVEPTIKNEGQVTYTCTACGIKKIETLPIAVTPKKGKTISAFNSQYIYKVTKSGTRNGTVEFAGTKDVANAYISIPDLVTISGITYKVTSIAKNVFKNNKNIKKVTIGKNITKINTGAFNGCKNLSVITIKSKNISSVGKNAFKGIKAKTKIKVPSSRLSKYKKLLNGKGQKSTVKITK